MTRRPERDAYLGPATCVATGPNVWLTRGLLKDAMADETHQQYRKHYGECPAASEANHSFNNPEDQCQVGCQTES